VGSWLEDYLSFREEPARPNTQFSFLTTSCASTNSTEVTVEAASRLENVATETHVRADHISNVRSIGR
jgi:hypothetical protein